MINLILFAVALFFAQSNLCLAAPPECKEPGAPKGCFEKSAASTPATLTPVPDLPVRSDIGELIANSPFFKLPTGDYSPFEAHTAKPNGTGGTMQEKTSIERVAGSPLCRYSWDLVSSVDNKMKSEALMWAGMIPISMRSSDTSKYSTNTSISQTTRLDKLTGQPFPLKSGNGFSVEWTSEYVSQYVGKKAETTVSVTHLTCQVGATGPASVVQAGLKGLATTLACTSTSSVSGRINATTKYWLDSVGCFVSIPKP
ncbi:MAG: hypothetical protein JJE30_00850 [Desulfuromonadales bacterium]|nr:hypothetical protein [Desulfuromonadales bacterium]